MRLGTWLGALLLMGGTAGASELAATLGWAQRAELGTLVSGVVSAVAVRPGQSVAAGEELLRLDDRGFRAQVAEAKAGVAQALVHYEEAERESRRADELYDRTVLSEHELQLAKIGFEEARAALQAARARSTQKELDLERSRILAPFDAVVLRVEVGPGQVVVSDLQSRPLVVVAERGRMVARALATVEQLAGLEAGKNLQVGVRGDWLDGRVSHMGLEPESGSGVDARYLLEVSVETTPGGRRLHAGEPAVIRFGGPDS